MFLNSWVPCQISHGPCPTLPVLFRLHLVFNTASELACLIWLCVNACERQKCFATICAFYVGKEKSSQFVDRLEWRPKSASAKPSKAPSGSWGPRVTLLTKITFSPGPSSLPSLFHFVHFPLSPNRSTQRWSYGGQTLSSYNSAWSIIDNKLQLKELRHRNDLDLLF